MLTLKKQNKNKYPFVEIKYKENKDDDPETVGEVYFVSKEEIKEANKSKKPIEGFPSLKLHEDSDCYFQLMLDMNKERDVLYVCGMAGSGKSYFIKQYVVEYEKLYPKRPIYLFSLKKEFDPSLKEIKKMKRVDIYHEDFLEEEMDYDSFKESLVIFDDIENIGDKYLKMKVRYILQQILQVGRQAKISVCYAVHEANNGHETKVILNECHSITLNVRNMGNVKLKYLLEGYFGFDKEQIQMFKNIESRMTTIVKTFPKVVIGEKDMFMI